ncbi:hypothetical protein FOL47_005776, partial [Perkinsus chesapeaki]
SSGEFVSAFIKGWLVDYDVPRVLLHDQDLAFTGGATRAWKKATGIAETTSVPYLARMNGKVERAHQGLKRCVRQWVESHGKGSWPDALRVAERVHNRRETSREGISPYQLIYGQRPREDWSDLINGLRHEDDSTKLCITDSSGFLEELHRTIQDTLLVYQEDNTFGRLHCNDFRRDHDFKVGDL